MRTFMILVSIMAIASSVIGADEAAFVESDDVIYGAKADEQGPIGGGVGYVNSVSSGDLTATTLEELIEALKKVEAGQVVFIPGDTEIDLTTFVYIEQLVLEVPSGVTLAGNRGADGSPGALLYSDDLNTRVMIRAMGPKVRITGLRLRGPNTKRYLDHHKRAFGPGGDGHAYYYKFPTQYGIITESEGLEVDNCEISGFGHAGISVRAGEGHHIHHNFIHHCQYNGLGYGISHDEAASIIEYNLFDWNRHSIAGTGRPGCSYIARHNIVLENALSHCFDMHGGRAREDGTDIAGTDIAIHNNTFYASTPSVAITGVPQEPCEIYHNWFVKCPPKRVVITDGNTEVSDNAYGNNPEIN